MATITTLENETENRKEGYVEGKEALLENFILKHKIYSSLSFYANPIQTACKSPLTPKRV